ncbi:MAG: hypothetical protein ACKO23_00730 [Gemmataceae bacterium]
MAPAMVKESCCRMGIQPEILRTSRPALTDLRFREDVWVVLENDEAHLCLGDFALSMFPICSFDLPSLNRLLVRVRRSTTRHLAGHIT